MANKKFLVSVADVVAMQGDNIIFTAKTLQSSAYSVTTSNTEIRGGQGNQLLGLYYHTSALSINIVDTQFRPEYIALNVGSKVTKDGGHIWFNESIKLNGTTGTLTNTPVSIDGTHTSAYTQYDGYYHTIPVTENTIDTSTTTIPENAEICVSYMINNPSAEQVIVKSDIIPDRVRLFLTAKIFGDTGATTQAIGKVMIEIPEAQLTGEQEISMSADNYSTTPLNFMAIAHSDTNAVCGNDTYYAKFTVVEDSANWYDDVDGLAVYMGDFELAQGGTSTLKVYAVKSGTGQAFLVDNSQLTFTSSATGVATVGEHTGLVTGVETSATVDATATINVKITAKATVETNVVVTVLGVE